MSRVDAVFTKIERIIKEKQSQNDWVKKCIPIVVDPNYVPRYNDKGELLPPPIMGGLSSTPDK